MEKLLEKILIKIKKNKEFKNNVNNRNRKHKIVNNRITLFLSKICCGSIPKLKNSTINIYGNNNIIYCDKGVVIENSIINFYGSNAVIYLSSNTNHYMINIDIFNNSTCYFSNNTFFADTVNLKIYEENNIIIGKDCIFSRNVWLRVADAYPIYMVKEKTRVNYSKSIYIGDHVWLGQNALVLKGSWIGSGSILAANSVLASKLVPSNRVYGGNPIRLIKKDVFFTNDCVYSWTMEETENNHKNTSNEYIYNREKKNNIIEELENKLIKYEDKSLEKVKVLNKLTKAKSRFVIKSK